MSQSPVDLDAVETASRQLLDDRMESVRALARARQDVHDQAAALREVEAVDKDAYETALKAGWSAPELRKVGLAPLPKSGIGTRSPNRGSTARRRTSNTTSATTSGDPGATGSGVDESPDAEPSGASAHGEGTES